MPQATLEPVEAKPSYLKHAVGALVLVGALLAIPPTVVSYFPGISVAAPTEPVENTNPFSEEFTVTNQSFFPLNDVTFSIGICHIIGSALPLTQDRLRECSNTPKLFNPSWKNHRLAHNEAHTISFSSLFQTSSQQNIGYADITLMVEYTPPLLKFWKRRVYFRFVTRKSQDGNIHWEQREAIESD